MRVATIMAFTFVAFAVAFTSIAHYTTTAVHHRHTNAISEKEMTALKWLAAIRTRTMTMAITRYSGRSLADTMRVLVC